MECEFYEIGCHYEWLIDEIKFLFIAFTDSILSGCAALIKAIPAPDFMANATTLSSGLTADLLYFTTMFQVPFGLSVCVAAYSLRFILRRIPLIG